jgi:hypothetical protein
MIDRIYYSYCKYLIGNNICHLEIDEIFDAI